MEWERRTCLKQGYLFIEQWRLAFELLDSFLGMDSILCVLNFD